MSDKNESIPLPFVAASALVGSSVLAALVAKLAERGIISDEDTRDIYDQALLALEQAEASAGSDDMRDIYSAARQIIEPPLQNT